MVECLTQEYIIEMLNIKPRGQNLLEDWPIFVYQKQWYYFIWNLCTIINNSKQKLVGTVLYCRNTNEKLHISYQLYYKSLYEI